MKQTIVELKVESTYDKLTYSKNKIFIHIKDAFNDQEVITLEMDNTQLGRLCSGQEATSILYLEDCNSIGTDKEGDTVDYKYLKDKIDCFTSRTTYSVMKIFQDFLEYLKGD